MVGYQTIPASRVDFDDVPDALRLQYRRMPIPPGVLLGRLAVDQAFHGQRVGRTLLVKALRQAVHLADMMDIAFVEVHALDDSRGYLLAN